MLIAYLVNAKLEDERKNMWSSCELAATYINILVPDSNGAGEIADEMRAFVDRIREAGGS